MRITLSLVAFTLLGVATAGIIPVIAGRDLGVARRDGGKVNPSIVHSIHPISRRAEPTVTHSHHPHHSGTPTGTPKYPAESGSHTHHPASRRAQPSGNYSHHHSHASGHPTASAGGNAHGGGAHSYKPTGSDGTAHPKPTAAHA